MSILQLSWRNFRFQFRHHLLSILLFSLAIAILWAVQEFSRQSEEKLKSNLANTDLVIGAKGSPLQIILSSLYHIDAPTGNIPLNQANRWMKHPMVQEALPLAYGDYYKQFKIVGSDTGIFHWYQTHLEKGKPFSRSGEVVLGAAVAHQTGLNIGDELSGQHGDAEGESGHGHYHVSGILAPTGSVLDQLVLCSLESVWAVHEETPDGRRQTPDGRRQTPDGRRQTPEDSTNNRKLINENQEITAVLIRYKNPMAAIQLPRMINENSKLQAAAPSIEINRLAFMLNNGSDTLRYVAYGILALAILSTFMQVWMGLKLRTKEFALLRHSGYSKSRLFFIIYLEYAFIGGIAFLLGEVLSRLFLDSFSNALGYGQAYTFSIKHIGMVDLYLLLLPLLAALIVILFNIRSLFKTSVADLLQNH